MIKSSVVFGLLTLAGWLPKKVTCEIRTINEEIKPTSSVVHFRQGYIMAPGYIDLSDVTFSVEDSIADEIDEAEVLDRDDGYYKEETDDMKQEMTGGSDGDPRVLDSITQAVEVVVFEEPADCARSDACDWSRIGLGIKDSEGHSHWCCSDDEITSGLCTTETHTFGKLMIDKARFKGVYRSIPIPSEGPFKSNEKVEKMDVNEGDGKYTIVIANCNDYGRTVKMEGSYILKSNHGFLPGERFQEWHFFITIFIIYILLFLWYFINMKKYNDASIQLQLWILLAIGVGLAESFFKVGDYWVWNEDGRRSWFAQYSGMILDLGKEAMSRVLVIMVCLGWGVVRDTLGDDKRTIAILGIAYIVTSAVFLISIEISNEELQHAEKDPGRNFLNDFIFVMNFIVQSINVFIYLWIFDALSNTIKHLESLSQHMKLRRYLRFRLILSFSVLFAVVWAVFVVVNKFVETAILNYEQQWSVQGAWEINYLMILISVAVLWRPHPDAKNYAYVMELSTDDNDFDMETSIEMIGEKVASSDDYDYTDKEELENEDAEAV